MTLGFVQNRHSARIACIVVLLSIVVATLIPGTAVAAGTWTPIASTGAPSPRYLQSAVWTGKEMLIWGGSSIASGFLGDGAAYDPATNIWHPLLTVGAPSPRYDASAIWTGTEMVVWGGTGPQGPLNDGAAYDPATNTWRPLPPAPVTGRCYQQ